MNSKTFARTVARQELVDNGLLPARRAAGAFGAPNTGYTHDAVPVRTYDYNTGTGTLEWLPRSATWTRAGLEALVQSAMEEFQDATGVKLPHNLAKGAWLHMANRHRGRLAFHERKEEYGDDEYVVRAARFAGWLRAIAKTPGKFPGIVKMIQRATSPWGQNARATKVNLWEFANAMPSPHRAENALWVIKRRAEAIITAWSKDLTVSWVAAAVGCMASPRSIGKAAVIATARVLFAGDTITATTQYKVARDMLVTLHQCCTRDTTDGVDARVADTAMHSEYGVKVYRGFHCLRYGRYAPMLLVRGPGGRSYHYNYINVRWAIDAALRAWTSQDAHAASSDAVTAFLQGDRGYVPLVYIQEFLRSRKL